MDVWRRLNPTLLSFLSSPRSVHCVVFSEKINTTRHERVCPHTSAILMPNIAHASDVCECNHATMCVHILPYVCPWSTAWGNPPHGESSTWYPQDMRPVLETAATTFLTALRAAISLQPSPRNSGPLPCTLCTPPCVPAGASVFFF